jgi:ribosomal protein S18 acetylase RimI-like enzyme
MILTAFDIARALEQAEALQLRRQVEAWGRLAGRSARVIEVCGGVAAFTDPAFGRKLNHATGLGLGVPIDAGSVAGLEADCAAAGVATEIDLCPHVEAGTLALLAARGYAVSAFSNTFVLPLSEAGAAPAMSDAIEIVDDRAEIERLFVAASVAGFSVQAQSRPVELLEALARAALARADTSLFVARSAGVVVGSAGMSLLETSAGVVAHFYIASTLPASRGRGVQTALLQARLAAARRAGAALAQVTVRPANVSARNTERAGFRLAYTKSTFARPVAARAAR